ncbi:unnamed protein product [Moneuplotes crassus]|uniref:FAD-binding PCMH-type domain-containing protein n=1 Tax=Euplotes crassus TaxID=5936 RepID=A0AAD1X9P5_EUPCR|nr:unnamed protein product [Moneuplotes crassus]
MFRHYKASSLLRQTLVGRTSVSSSLNCASAPQIILVHSQNRSYSKLNQDDVNHFKGILNKPEVAVIEDLEGTGSSSELSGYNTDWLNKLKGNSKLALRPSSTEEVSQILKYCNSRQLAVVPQGGNTGLVGGSVPLDDEIVLSLNRMNNIIGFDKNYSILKTQAGVVLEKLIEYLEQFGYMPPVDLGARGSCHIGGNLATNAGGIKLLKYNSLHANTIGLTAVLPDGTILDNMRALRKDNTGYHLKHLFIGSEGTLGVITEAAILCPKIPAAHNVALFALDNFDKVEEVLRASKDYLSENLTAIEFFDSESNNILKDHTKHRNPLGYSHNYYMVVEVSNFDNTSTAEENTKIIEDKFFGLFEKISTVIEDGVIAQDSSQREAIWNCRERIVEGFFKEGMTFKYDFSLPIDKFPVFLDKIRDKLGDHARTGGYGHIGDGNIHVNASIKGYDNLKLFKELQKELEPWVFSLVEDYEGSISAEHGIGSFKAPYFELNKSNKMVSVMKQIKGVLDPNGIMNPHKLFD